MKLRRTLLAVFLPLALLGVASCGGSGGGSTESTATTNTTTAALTKAELIEQGDAICAEVNAAVGSVGASSAENDPTARAAGLYSGMVSSLNNLGTPRESAGYAEFSSAAEELAKAEDEVKLAAERGDTTALETAESSASSALTNFQEAAEEYGFEDCAEGPSAPAPSAGSTAESEGAEEAEAGEETEAVEPEVIEPEAEAEPAPEPAPETGGGAGAVEGGGTGGGTEGGGATGGSSGGIGPG